MASSEIASLVGLDQNNNNSSSGMKKMSSKNYEKYSLRPRSIQKRIETEKRAKEPKKVPKPKLKPPPLSKYRRKTANARERTRMQEINIAFETLQRVVPQYPILPVNAQGKTCEKLTKITTLRLAMNYISNLNNLLSGGSGKSEGLMLEDDPFSNMSPDSSSGSSSFAEFSPASSSSCYGLSPCPVTVSLPPPPPPLLSYPVPPGPESFQTVMRSVVLPPASQSRRNGSGFLSPSTHTLNNNNTNLFTNTPNGLSGCPVSINLSASSYLPTFAASSLLLSSSTVSPVHKFPSTVKYNHLINQSLSSFMAKCSGNRTGSLSSLTESDLSEYTSDLLSDEGSTLDDPMFDDIMGMDTGACGTVDDLDHLILESDGDSIHFSSDPTDN